MYLLKLHNLNDLNIFIYVTHIHTLDIKFVLQVIFILLHGTQVGANARPVSDITSAILQC